MSYVVAAALQKAVFAQLETLDTPVFDGVPPGAVPDLYIAIGPEEARDASDTAGGAAIHLFTISVFSSAPSFAKAKSVAGDVCDVLTGTYPPLERGILTDISFRRARASRVQQGGGRQIDLRFRAYVQDA